MGLSYSEDRIILTGVILTLYRTVTDGRTDRIYHSALRIIFEVFQTVKC